MVAFSIGNCVPTYYTSRTICTQPYCPCCGQTVTDPIGNYSYATSRYDPPTIDWNTANLLRYFWFVLDMWRPRPYRRPVSYSSFITREVQRARPRCRDPPEGFSVTRPVRLQLSRAKGFNLQALSITTNGLPAVNCARPSKYGNPFWVINEEGWPWITDKRDPGMPVCNKEAARLIGCGEEIFWRHVPQALVALFRQQCVDSLQLEPLRGKNLACFCEAKQPCHCDVLLELANAPREGAQ